MRLTGKRTITAFEWRLDLPDRCVQKVPLLNRYRIGLIFAGVEREATVGPDLAAAGRVWEEVYLLVILLFACFWFLQPLRDDTSSPLGFVSPSFNLELPHFSTLVF